MDVVAGQVPELLLTGERTLPGIPHENYWFRRHEAAYEALAPICRGASVLEAGCGEGYGADLVAGAAARVTGLDYDAATVAHVRRRYPRVAVVRGDLQRMGFRGGSFDVVMNLQVVEHLWDQPGFVAECARLLRPGGRLVVTTPNRLTFSPSGVPVNPFHTRELAAAELAELLAGSFAVEAMLGLHHGPRLRALDEELGQEGPATYGSGFVDAQLAAPPADWPADLARAVEAVTAADFEIHDRDVDTSLDLVAVAVRR